MTSKLWQRFGAGILFLWMAFAAPASAGDWQYFAGDASEATLDCFGDMKTAKCAAETYLLCATWYAFLVNESRKRTYGPPREEILSLCPQVEQDYPVGLTLGKTEVSLLSRNFYRLYGPWTIGEDSVPRWARFGSGRYYERAGDTAFDVEATICRPSYPCALSGSTSCPIVACRSFPGEPVTFRTPPMGEYRFPYAVIVLRQDGDQWYLVSFIRTAFEDRQGIDRWRPRHFRVGSEAGR